MVFLQLEINSEGVHYIPVNIIGRCRLSLVGVHFQTGASLSSTIQVRSSVLKTPYGQYPGGITFLGMQKNLNCFHSSPEFIADINGFIDVELINLETGGFPANGVCLLTFNLESIDMLK
jgi:hypothetical protein